MTTGEDNRKMLMVYAIEYLGMVENIGHATKIVLATECCLSGANENKLLEIVNGNI